ncbi:MAG: hypothetical protein K2J82_04870 [Muribaculaceae bacterium]|nr:hypothetical protein [Muribaculaceae bacterium]
MKWFKLFLLIKLSQAQVEVYQFNQLRYFRHSVIITENHDEQEYPISWQESDGKAADGFDGNISAFKSSYDDLDTRMSGTRMSM